MARRTIDRYVNLVAFFVVKLSVELFQCWFLTDVQEKKNPSSKRPWVDSESFLYLPSIVARNPASSGSGSFQAGFLGLHSLSQGLWLSDLLYMLA